MTRTVRALMSGLIDYAGLFPPARLAMDAAAEEYERARRSAEAWMLGRFCAPGRLEELSGAGVGGRAARGEPWQ